MKRNKKGTVVTSITLPEEVYDWTVKQAEDNQRSFSSMVSVILSEQKNKLK